MWAVLVCVAAFCNALWMARSQQRLRQLSAISFSIVFRALTSAFLLPLFIYGFEPPGQWLFWVAAVVSGLREAVQVVLLSLGVRRDYYATYSLYNTAPLFLVVLAPGLLHERVGLWVVVGAVLIVVGGLTFYRVGRFSLYGLLAAFLSAVGTILSKFALGFSSWLFYPFVQFLVATVALLPWALRGRRREDLRTAWRQPRDLVTIAFLSFVATVGFYAALQVASATRVGLLFRINLLFAFGISYFLLRERADWKHRLAGGALILVGCVLVSIA